MLRKLRIIFETVLCVLVLLLGWQNMRLQSRLAELESAGAAGALAHQPSAEAQTPHHDQSQIESNQNQTRELMRLRAEVTRLKSQADNPQNNPRESATQMEPAQPGFPEQLAGPGDTLPQQPLSEGSTSSEALAVMAIWGKVKISQAGSITLDNKPIDLEAFAVECERVKSANRGFVLFVDAPGGRVSPAQFEAMQPILKAEIRMRAVTTEDEL